MVSLSCAELSTREINRVLRELPDGAQATITEPRGTHNLAVGLTNRIDVTILGHAGYYIVIQEHPTEPRFGLDVGTPTGSASHLGIAAGPPSGLPLDGLQWARNAAHMAGITRQLPVRIAIHASQLVTPA